MNWRDTICPLITLIVAGCTYGHSFDPNAKANINVIALSISDMPEYSFVSQVLTPPFLTQERRNTMDLGGFRVSEKLRETLVADLSRDGYKVTRDQIPPPEKGHLGTSQAQAMGVDAILYVTIGSITYGAALGSDYNPTMGVDAELIDTNGRSIYHRRYAYLRRVASVGLMPDIPVFYEPDPKYTFTSYDELTHNQARANEAFLVGASAISHAIATDMAK